MAWGMEGGWPHSDKEIGDSFHEYTEQGIEAFFGDTRSTREQSIEL
jgi:hypothetical protein